MSPTNCNVVIVGGGPAGCSTALALSQAGVSGVVLVDGPASQTAAVGESATPDVGLLLRELGVGLELDAAGHQRYHGNRTVWGAAARFESFLARGELHGFHLDRARFNAQLRDATVASGVTWIRDVRVTGCRRTSGGVVVMLRDGRSLSARWVVDASGRHARVARSLGVRRRELDSLVASLAHLPQAPAASLVGQSLVESSASGWWYAAPQGDRYAAVYLISDASLSRRAGWRNPEAFLQELSKTVELCRYVTSTLEGVEVSTVSARTSFLERIVGPHWIAVGDAACALDPLTSSGISGALRDGLAASKVVCAGLRGDAVDAGPLHSAARSYARRVNALLNRYCVERLARYRQETRWENSPFWRQRHGRFGGFDGMTNARVAK